MTIGWPPRGRRVSTPSDPRAPMNRTTANLAILSAAAIWGLAFVPQQTAMKSLSPMWFLALRFALSMVVTAPFLLAEAKRAQALPSGRAWRMIGGVAAVFLVANILQQLSLLTTSVTNAGFITSLYILFTPIVAMALTHERPGAAVWPAAALGLFGAWLLGGGGADFVVGDVLLMFGAVLWATQIVLIGRTMRFVNRPLLLVMAQYAAIVVGAGSWADRKSVV